jgi:hypothetical protein
LVSAVFRKEIERHDRGFLAKSGGTRMIWHITSAVNRAGATGLVEGLPLLVGEIECHARKSSQEGSLLRIFYHNRALQTQRRSVRRGLR